MVSAAPTLLQSIASTLWPVTNVTAEVCSRCVSGTPVYAAMPSGVVTPGTISNGMPGGGQRFDLFAAAPEDERIAALQPHHGPAAARALDQHAREISSCVNSCADALLADVDALGMRGRQVEQTLVRQMIVEDRIGALQNLAAFDGDEPGIAGAGADQIDLHAA